jgi:DNA-directed RNA polymerase specialized sigma24 family protein
MPVPFLQVRSGRRDSEPPVPGRKTHEEEQPGGRAVAADSGGRVDELDQALAAHGCFSMLSLDRPEAKADLTLAEVVADEDYPTLEQLEAVDVLQPVLEDLSDRDRRILQLRFVEGWTQHRCRHRRQSDAGVTPAPPDPGRSQVRLETTPAAA